MLFTVFTPTYNRARTLHRVYESLQAQSLRDFEWLVVDDGSTDNTKEIVDRWQKEADFPIRYVWQANGHKKTAFNHGVRLAKGQFFLTADSDDRFVPHALERFAFHWRAIPEAKRAHFAGVCGLCQDENGKLIGNQFPGIKGLDSDSLEIFYRHKILGEKWGFTRTQLLKVHPFPENLPGHVPEGVVWSAIATTHKTRFVNEVLRIYCQDAGDQLTHDSDPALDAPGNLYWKTRVLSHNIRWFRRAPLSFMLDAARWLRFRLHLNKPLANVVNFWPSNWLGRILILIMSPVGFAWWLSDRLKSR